MDWNTEVAAQFDAAIRDFPFTGYTLKHKLAEHIVSKGHRKLATEFLKRCTNIDTGQAINAAKAANLCKLCSCFVRLPVSVCGPCFKTPEGRALAVKLRLRKTRKTCLEKYGVEHANKNPEVSKRLSEVLCARYQDPKAKRTTIRRRMQTNLERYGHPFPNQRPDILRKAMISRIKVVAIQGRKFEYQGWEDVAIRYFAKRFGAEQIATQFDEGFKTIYLSDGTRYRPDIYLRNNGFYIECKSSYTLAGKAESLSRNIQKARLAYEGGAKIVWMVISKEGRFKAMPHKWWLLPRKEIKRLATQNLER